MNAPIVQEQLHPFFSCDALGPRLKSKDRGRATPRSVLGAEELIELRTGNSLIRIFIRLISVFLLKKSGNKRKRLKIY